MMYEKKTTLFKVLLEDPFTAIRGRPWNPFAYLGNLSGGSIEMGRMARKLTYMARNIKQTPYLDTCAVFMIMMFHVLFAWYLKNQL